MMEFTWDNPDLQICQRIFNDLPDDSRLFKSHYELAKETMMHDAATWKAFLTDNRVSDWITSDMNLFKEVQMRKAIKNSTDNTRSVGAAQMITALSKTLDDTVQKDGPVFIYTHVPLTIREQTVSTAVILDTDIFHVEE